MDIIWHFSSLAFIVFIPLLLLPFLRHRNAGQRRTTPAPGPRKLPIIGNLHQVGGDLSNVRILAKKYGPLMSLQLGSAGAVVVSSPEMVKEIFQSHDIIFSNRPPLYAARKLSYGCKNIAFANFGEHWREVKKIAVVELLGTKMVHSFHQIRDEEVTRMIDSISPISKTFIDLSQLTLSLANDVLCRAVCGRTYTNKDEGKIEGGKTRLQELLLETQQLLGEFNIADFYPILGKVLNRFNGFDTRLERYFRELDKFFSEVIEEHRQSTRVKSKNDDLLDVLLQLQKDPSTAITREDEQIKAILLDMFVGGTDPSWATMVWTMTELIKHPEAMKKVQDEVRTTAGTDKSKFKETDLPKLKYLRWVILEVLRLHPPNPFPRETTECCTVNGFEIPAKTRVYIDAKAIGRDEDHWENPDSFEPERFAKSSVKWQGSGDSSYEFIPFGVGRRGCPGRNFGMAVMELALANLLLRFDWSLPDRVARDGVDMSELVGLTTHKTVPLVLVATPWP